MLNVRCSAVLFVCALTVLFGSLSSFAHAADAKKINISLNWVPEPEFGGIYAAKQIGAFEKRGLDAAIKPGGAGAPTWQMVASGQVEFAVSSADEVVIARSQGADVVALFTTYQTCPQGIMVHQSRGLKSIDEVFTSGGTLAMEIGLPYGKYLQKKYGFEKVKRIPYDGGIGNFLADKNFMQQCFVFSEPLAAKKQGGDPQTFLIADAGYNPYTGVIITSGAYLKKNPAIVRAVDAALREGWQAYQEDPKPANEVMAKLNKNMDPETFAAAAAAQKPLVESDETKANGLGAMTLPRWTELVKQLTDLGVVESGKAPPAKACFVVPAVVGAVP
jgi:NitT/TauT family transport system substrate-binding protein